MDKLETKQQVMVKEARKLIKNSSQKDSKMEHIEKERLLRRIVYHTIVQLSDTVTEEFLLQKLNNLDVNSWWEVVEERYIGDLCGFPSCPNAIEKKSMSMYRIDRKNKKIFERCTEKQKFCSEECFLRSAYVLCQLADEPLWIRGYRQSRKFNLNLPTTPQQMHHKSKTTEIEKVEFIKERGIVAKFSDLHIGESADTDEEKTDDEAENREYAEEEDRICKLSRQEDKYLETKKQGQKDDTSLEVNVKEEKTESEIVDAQTSSSTLYMNEGLIINDCGIKGSPSKPSAKKPKDEGMLSVAEKLAKIRAKYSKENVKKAPIIVEARPLDLALHAKIADTAFEDFERTAKEWVSSATIAYLRRRGTVGLFDDEALTEVESVMMQFYAGDRPSPGSEPTGDMILPRVDRYDQVAARRDVLMEALLPSWRTLEREIKVEGCAHKAFPLIATFSLNADNVNLEKAEARVAVAFIFRLMAHCDSELLDEYFPNEGCVSANFAAYLQSVDCHLNVFNRMVTHVMKQLASLEDYET